MRSTPSGCPPPPPPPPRRRTSIRLSRARTLARRPRHSTAGLPCHMELGSRPTRAPAGSIRRESVDHRGNFFRYMRYGGFGWRQAERLSNELDLYSTGVHRRRRPPPASVLASWLRAAVKAIIARPRSPVTTSRALPVHNLTLGSTGRSTSRRPWSSAIPSSWRLLGQSTMVPRSRLR